MRMVFTVNEFGRYDLDGGQWAVKPQGTGFQVMYRTGLEVGAWEFVAFRATLHEACRYIWQAVGNGAPARYSGGLPD